MFNIKLIDDWRTLWWRRWSTWAAAFNAAITGPIIANQAILLGLLPYVPGMWKALIVAVVCVLLFVLPVILALLRQPKIEQLKAEGKING